MRCFLPADAWGAESATLSAEESHYACQVLRAGVGSELEVFDGRGRTALATIVQVRHRRVTVALDRAYCIAPPRPALHLWQALPKSGKMEWIIQKGTELGMIRLTPLSTERAVVRLDPKRATSKQERWRDIALSAIRQCKRAWVPVIESVQTPEEAMAAPSRPEVLLWADLRPGARPLSDVIRNVRTIAPASIGIAIGPEGDFSEREASWFDQAGAVAVSLGDAVLRTETAAMYALCILQYEFHPSGGASAGA